MYAVNILKKAAAERRALSCPGARVPGAETFELIDVASHDKLISKRSG